LSPTSAVTCPAGTTRSTPTSAWTGPKFFETPRRRRSGSSPAANGAGGVPRGTGLALALTIPSRHLSRPLRRVFGLTSHRSLRKSESMKCTGVRVSHASTGGDRRLTLRIRPARWDDDVTQCEYSTPLGSLQDYHCVDFTGEDLNDALEDARET
jgi:hypothetical protein